MRPGTDGALFKSTSEASKPASPLFAFLWLSAAVRSRTNSRWGTDAGSGTGGSIREGVGGAVGGGAAAAVDGGAAGRRGAATGGLGAAWFAATTAGAGV